MTKYIYIVVLWDEVRNKQLKVKMVSIKRKTKTIATEYMRTNYPRPYFYELHSETVAK